MVIFEGFSDEQKHSPLITENTEGLECGLVWGLGFWGFFFLFSVFNEGKTHQNKAELSHGKAATQPRSPKQL